MRVGVIGINHKIASLRLRELLAKACQRRFLAGSSLHGDHTCVLLSTCNRTEVYFASSDLAATHTYLLQVLRNEVEDDFDQKVYSYFGQDCFLHLSRVTAGLDSAILAETEIQGQVKVAYESAIEHLHLPSELHFLFQKALKIGKKIRTELLLGRGMPDLEHAIFNAGSHLFRPEEVNVLFVGASNINLKILSFLKSKNIHRVSICNRTLDRSKVAAETYGVSVLEWEKIGAWHRFDWVILGTKAPDYLICRTDLPEGITGRKLLFDLCVPRNVDPKLGSHPNVTLLNIDQINRILRVRKHQMSQVLSHAEQFVAHSAKQYVELFQEKEKSKFRNLAVSA